MFLKIIAGIITAFLPKDMRCDVKYRITHIKENLYVKRIAKSVGKNFKCGKNIQITKKVSIGNDVTINGIGVKGCGNLTIGNHIQIGEDLLVLTSNHNYEGDKLPFDDKNIAKDVIIEDFCWIGSRVTLLPGTHIKEGSIIQAGSVVRGTIPPCSIAGGNPAIVFKKRDEKHYEKLKSKGEFYSNSLL